MTAREPGKSRPEATVPLADSRRRAAGWQFVRYLVIGGWNTLFSAPEMPGRPTGPAVLAVDPSERFRTG